MKSEQYILISDKVKANVTSRIIELPADGKIKVTISDASKKTVRQQGLQWRWYTDVANAGVGGKHESTKNGVHLVSKYHWAIPILVRDDPFFAELYSMFKEKHGDCEDMMRHFVDTQVSTEKFNRKQMAEVLTDFYNHYSPLVALSDPEDWKLLGKKRA